jgi:transcription-repair coupling factor (superfamily II helicase)
MAALQCPLRGEAMHILAHFRSSKTFDDLFAAVSRGPRTAHVVGASGAARHFLAAALVDALAEPWLVVVHHAGAAERFAEDLRAWLAPRQVLSFPANPYLPYEVLAKSPDLTRARLGVLRRLCAATEGPPPVVVATVESLLGTLAPAGTFRDAVTTLAPGRHLPLEELVPRLLALGYERDEHVTAPGQFALRGGILDFWDPAEDAPVRAEFYGDEVEAVRRFDPNSQRSTARLDGATLGPAHEWPFRAEEFARLRERLRRDAADAQARLASRGLNDAAMRLRQRLNEDLEASVGPVVGPALAERYAAMAYDPAGHLLEYFPRPPAVLLDEPVRLWETARSLAREAAERATVLLERGDMLPAQAAVYVPVAKVQAAMARGPRVAMSALLTRAGQEFGEPYAFSPRPGEAFHGRFDEFIASVERHRRADRRLVVAAATRERVERLAEALRRRDLPVRAMPDAAHTLPEPREIVVLNAALEGGFAFPELGLFVYTDAEIQGRRRRRPRRSSGGGEGVRLEDLAVGDLVVHVHHGLARYLGLRPMDVDGHRHEYLELQYAGADRLFVPTDQVSLIQRYVGPEGRAPKLSHLGGGDWAKTKARVRASVRRMAQDLLQLYAAREATVGTAFAPDTPWQRDMEDAFPYEETPDQLRAIREIKQDMERPRPMDRLLCGDVGYGKTEVAVRAAFKAVMDGMQAAVLVPTTILADQHYRTFEERLRGFPVRVDLLSRFRTPAQQKDVLRRLAEGRVDVIIGTHRLLGKDVRFKNLGLLIVDEEQRFGVSHKERIKALKVGVDCLTLTATPIPRTLHMSLVGVRDMSLIETPPEDRFPVQTYVVEWSEELVTEAIRRELGRGGQVFYVHNRIETMDGALSMLMRHVPEARIAVAHGRKNEVDLERTMIAFLDGEYDILLATSIIESGLDMPQVNTLIVEDADRLGLSTLYQLRGRVGRSNRLAYAYFTYRRDKVLSEVAEKRLAAISQFTDFGSGFQIAMRDLEIRGAGNLLGAEQHGFMVSVGFEMYRQLLAEAVRELKGEERPHKDEQPTQVEVPITAYIPDRYMPDSRDKMEAYRRIADATDGAALDEIADELQDRFGPTPPELHNLLQVARVRVLGQAIGVRAVRCLDADRSEIELGDLRRLDGSRLAALQQGFWRARVHLHGDRGAYLVVRHPGHKPEEILETIAEVLSVLQPASLDRTPRPERVVR